MNNIDKKINKYLINENKKWLNVYNKCKKEIKRIDKQLDEYIKSNNKSTYYTNDIETEIKENLELTLILLKKIYLTE